MGETWEHIADHVFDFEWASNYFKRAKQQREHNELVPLDRIIVTKSSQSGFISSHGSIDLYYSDDYFQTSATMVL